MFYLSLDIAIVLLLSSYFLITIAYHFDNKNWIARHLDYFGFIPKWNFFAPTPGVNNLYLLYRVQYHDGTMGNWKSLFEMDQYRSPWTCIWNPNKRLKKALFDLIITLTSEDLSSVEKKAKVKMSIPYLLILNHLSIFDDEKTMSIQFVIMENYSDKPAYAIFTSELHAL